MKLIRIDMTSKSIKVEDVPEKYQKMGGRGLTSVMINTEMPAGCDPLGPENKLIFAPGLLSGTNLVNSGRLSVGHRTGTRRLPRPTDRMEERKEGRIHSEHFTITFRHPALRLGRRDLHS